MPVRPSVVIVGAGMAGLTCAVYLKQAGLDALIVEASDGVGGRVRTDRVDGFRLDRGFQILLTAYPETKRLLDYTALRLQSFRSGALIRDEDRWMLFINPLQEPTGIFPTLFSPVGTFADKLRVVELMGRVSGIPTYDLFRQQATSTQSFLEDFGYSDRIINLFFRPFFGGVFLEDSLRTSSNFFEFCFKTFYSGDAAVPALGMQAIPDQLAARLDASQIRLNTPVEAIEGQTLRLANGETIQADTIVLAVDAHAAQRLLGTPTEPRFNKTTCTYFAAPASPKPEKLLMLNPHRQAAVHNVAIMSDVARDYAPAGQTLISVSTQGLDAVNQEGLTERIRRELTDWFGEEVKAWRWLRTYHLPEALPQYNADARPAPLKLAENLYQCGDQTSYPSLNAAMQTGREVAQQIIKN
ncbi:NAD(P)/FAD-dependent oxidoreductase [Tellurirhabdus rosea]|uniref:NAD(P)/FAD-dependent oxidoreductase n=1 Tax=Tellurirhabdus rosea TaxID=2674997 RepID=UPI00225A72B8|nr:NAD(P)/FAD-dependent oxidoreductase [Tellurirhabdus rosea]